MPVMPRQSKSIHSVCMCWECMLFANWYVSGMCVDRNHTYASVCEPHWMFNPNEHGFHLTFPATSSPLSCGRRKSFHLCLLSLSPMSHHLSFFAMMDWLTSVHFDLFLSLALSLCLHCLHWCVYLAVQVWWVHEK